MFELVDMTKYCPGDRHGKSIGGYCEDCGLDIRTRLPPVQCTCGRFAKFIRSEKYYNGTWNCERLWVRCSRCGDVGIEVV